MRLTLAMLTLNLTVSAALSPVRAQSRTATEGVLVSSLGQPGFWKWSGGAAMGASRRDGIDQRTTELRGALSRDVLNPVIGLAAMQFETFAGTRDGDLDGGVRARLGLPFFRAAVGGEYNVADRSARWQFSLMRPGRRGGLFGDGTMVRLDATPGRDWSLALGIEKPIQRRIPAGQTRPRSDHVSLHASPAVVPRTVLGADVETVLQEAGSAAEWIGRFTVPWLDHTTYHRTRAESLVVARVDNMRKKLSITGPDGVHRARLMEQEVRRFHALIERAFQLTLADAAITDSVTPARVARRAREVLLDEVLLPYDRLLGQDKRDDTTIEFARRARSTFARWIYAESPITHSAADNVLSVFTALLSIVEQNRAAIRRESGDSRFVWLPLQYALLPEEHDTQAELDAIVERAVAAPFEDGNFVSYVINEQFQFQLARTIREANDYHVLWIHDVRGVDGQGDPDELAYNHVLRSYLHTLTARVRQYDRTGSLPTYIILLDEWFYRVRQTRMWMNLLENPLRGRVRLPAAYAHWDAELTAAQDSLRKAVAESKLLQAHTAQYGEDWLRGLVKVHVNITNAADHTFWSRHVTRFLAVPDNVYRDHRKLVFYDITEADPYRGEAIYTGAGVGEHYANKSWEDRSLLVRGPVALHLKLATRELLLSQGMKPDEIPPMLRAMPQAADYDAKIRTAMSAGAQQSVRALGVHNQTGFGNKDVNVTKAVLYTLMPPGSVIKIPDSLWNSAFWGSTLIGCSLRGVRVLVIAPSLANAPAPAFGSMELAYELLWRLVTVSQRLAPELAERGGLLRVGMYASTLPVTDIAGKVRAVQRTFAEHEWLRTLFNFSPNVYEGLESLASTLEPLEMAPTAQPDFEFSDVPKLHLKSNMMASREAWQLLAQPEWLDMTWEFVQQRIAQVQLRATAVGTFERYPDALLVVGDGTVRRWFDALTSADRERVIFYTVMGSQNQNTRSMVMDAEDALVISGWPSIIPYIDLVSVIGQSVWLDDPAQLRALLPPKSALQTRLSHWLYLAF